MFRVISQTLKWIGQHFLGMLFVLLVVVLLLPNSSQSLHPANLQEIQLKGAIMEADSIVEQIEAAQHNPQIKGVLLTVDSPGGAVAPSIEIAYAIRALRTTKPVIAYASGTMASGSYYSAIYANKIIANPGSIVGSIGVIMQSMNTQELFKTIGIKPQVVKQGTYKEAGTSSREWSPQERAELEQLTKDTYDLFVHDVATARGLDINASLSYADAHIFSAGRAKRVGLIDEVATKSLAKQQLATLAKVSHPQWQKKGRIDSFFEKLESRTLLHLQSYFYGLKASL